MTDLKLFTKTGLLLPMYDALKANGERIVIAQPDKVSKDIGVALIKAHFALEGVVAYVFMSEAWVLRTTVDRDPDIEHIARNGLEHHPDRREVIMFQAEDTNGGSQTAYRYILRPEHRKAVLAPLHMDDMTGVESEGRMVGLLLRK